MALPSITASTIFAGDRNQGLQVGHNSGNIESHFHVPADRPETPPQPSCFVPFRRDPDFVGRATLLDQIDKQCSVPASRVALVGLGGVGKSQLAIEHCYRTAERSPETWVLWAHASNTARLEQSFRDIAEIVKVRGRKEPHADIFRLVHDWLRDEKNGRWLLVVDNADDADVLSARADKSQNSQTNGVASADDGGLKLHRHLSTHLPQSRHGSVLVTSRTRQAAIQVVEDSDIIPIEPMDAAAAHTLLRKKLGDETSAEGIDGKIDELAAALDHMPLALAQAASYIRRRAPRCSVQQYLEQYKQSDGKASNLLNQEAGRLRRDESANNAILLTWQISFDHVRSIRQSAANLLSLMSFFDRQGIPEDLLYGYYSPAKDDDTEDENTTDYNTEDNVCFDNDLQTLRDYFFVTITKDTNMFEMHSLVQLATRKWLEGQGQLNHWREHFISNLSAQLPLGEYENWKQCQALFPHARAAMTQRPQSLKSLEEWALLLYNAGLYAYRRDRANETEEMAVLSSNARKDMLGQEHADTLNSMELVGMATQLKGKYREAEVIHRQLLATRKKVLGCDHQDTLDSMMNLAFVLDLQGRYLEAEATHRQVLAMQERVLGHEHSNTLMTIQNLGWVLLNQGKYQEGEAILRQALVLSQKVLGLEHPRTLNCASDLASALDRQGRCKEAEVISREVLAIREKVLGREHHDTLMSAHNLAYTLGKQGRWKEAEVIKREVLAIREKVLGRKHHDTLTSAHNLAFALKKQGRYKEAEAIYRQTLATKEDVLGLEHPETLISMSCLAYLLAQRGCYGESLALYDRAYAGSTDVLGEDHPDTRRCYRHRSAFATWERSESTAIRERDLAGMRDLANRLGTYEYHGMATALYDKACAEFQKALGEDHPATRECFEDRSRLASWLQARTSADADADASTSMPLNQESVPFPEMVSTTPPSATSEYSIIAPSVEEVTAASVEITNDAGSISADKVPAAKEQLPIDHSSAVADVDTSTSPGKAPKLSRGSGEVHFAEPQTQKKLRRS